MFIGFLIIIITTAISYKAFKSYDFFESLVFRVDNILIFKDYKRLITSGFVHVSWQHLIMNMLSLYFFSGAVYATFGPFMFIVVYLVSMVGGSLFSLLVHRYDGAYSAVGASGAVCGVVFASVAVFPDMQINIFFIPLGIPAWIYALVFVLYSIYGIRSQKDNIGHEAHLGGALVGMLLAILVHPQVITANYLPILLITLPAVFFIYMIIKKPAFLFVDNLFYKNQRYHSIDERYNNQKVDKQKEVDRILEKIHQRGMDSLTTKERQTLDDFSK